MIRRLFFLAICSQPLVWGTPYFPDEVTTAWFTGTLLSPEGHTLPAGITQVEPYIFASDGAGVYGHVWNRWMHASNVRSINPVVKIGHGITNWFDFNVVFQGEINHNKATSIRRADIFLEVGFQLFNDRKTSWIPDVKIFFTQSFPFGSYRNLNPEKNRTDQSGSGSYETTAALALQKLFHTGGPHFFKLHVSAGFTRCNKLHVRGFNAYGGGYGTSGTVHPGHKFTGVVGFEYSITRSVALATDFVGFYASKPSFGGNRGLTSSGSQAPFFKNASYELSMAPALEYNFSEYIGMIGGVWFPLYNRTSENYFSFVLAFNNRF